MTIAPENVTAESMRPNRASAGLDAPLGPVGSEWVADAGHYFHRSPQAGELIDECRLRVAEHEVMARRRRGAWPRPGRRRRQPG